MTNSQELTDEQLGVLARVEKLLRLAGRNSSPEEAASAAAKAQELLAAYNLTAAQVSADEDRSAVREERSVRGGMYAYQRELWDAVARLNFCLHWTITHEVFRKRGRGAQGTDYWGHEFRHTLVGRQVNVRSTMALGVYLEQAIERLVRERYPTNTQRFTREATAYREGAADQVILRLRERRRDAEAAERRRAAEAARAGVVTAQALTVASYAQQEQEANADLVMGAGWSARQRADREERARKLREAEAEYAAWAAAHPEEARREAKKAEREAASSRGRTSRGRRPDARQRRSWSAQYAQGYDAGRSVGLDQQAEGATPRAPRLTEQRRLT